MRKYYLLILLFLFPVFSYGQFVGVGGQYSEDSKGQFAANLSFPFFHPKNKLNSYISSGLDYTTTGEAKLSGLNVKPIQITTFFNENFFNSTKYTLLLSVDGGYLLNFRNGSKNGVVITPNLYFDYKFFFVKAGYDFDVTNGINQYFVRTGICFGMGAIKMFDNVKIW